jgi:hypothetical protein
MPFGFTILAFPSYNKQSERRCGIIDVLSLYSFVGINVRSTCTSYVWNAKSTLLARNPINTNSYLRPSSDTVLRATNLCIRVSRVPASKMSNRIRWLDGAGLLEDSLKPCRNLSKIEHPHEKSHHHWLSHQTNQFRRHSQTTKSRYQELQTRNKSNQSTLIQTEL